jgi:hypothetical protein
MLGETGSSRLFKSAAVPGRGAAARAGRHTGRRRTGRIVDVGDHHVDWAVPGERGQHRGDHGGPFGCRDRPAGTNLHGHPAVPDHDALNLAAGQIRGDPAERAAVKPGHARAPPDGRGDSVDIDTVYDGGSGSAVRWRHGHATREGAS